MVGLNTSEVLYLFAAVLDRYGGDNVECDINFYEAINLRFACKLNAFGELVTRFKIRNTKTCEIFVHVSSHIYSSANVHSITYSE